MARRTVADVIPRPLTWLLVVVCAVLVPLGVVSAWTATMLSDTDKYVETVGPLADDPEVTAALAEELNSQALHAIGPPANQRGKVQSQVRVATARAVLGPEFPTVWREANRVVHEQLVDLLSNKTLPTGEVVEIDLSPLAEQISAELEERNLRADLSGADLTVEVTAPEELEQARTAWQVVQAAGYWLPIVAGVLLVVTMVTARRKLATLGHLAIAVGLTLVLTRIGLWAATSVAHDKLNDTVEPLWDTVTGSLADTLVVAIVVAVVALAVRIAIGLGRGVTRREA